MNSTLKLNATWKGGYRTDVQAGKHLIIIDQPEKGGGKDKGPDPLTVFLSALGGCLGTISAIIAKQERIKLNGLEIEVEGDIDKAFLMGKTEEGRAGFTEIRVNVNIDADMTDEEKQAFIERVDARCPISDNMGQNTKLAFTVK
ncbi:MAG: OsmC family protein [Chloroflexota bacterium]|nr:OsmC family protein [Chloroflexota bacterium]